MSQQPTNLYLFLERSNPSIDRLVLHAPFARRSAAIDTVTRALWDRRLPQRHCRRSGLLVVTARPKQLGNNLGLRRR